VNEPVRRGRVTGTDLLPAFAAVAPLHVFGMKTEDLAAAAGFEGARLHVRGDLKPGELHRELARCRVYVHPMRWTSLGLSLLEAMHLGMPVVALATTEAPRAVPPEAGAVSADVGELLRSAARLIANPEEARRRGAAAREAALARYSLARFLDDWDALLADLRPRSRPSVHERPDEQILVPARERKTP
jgi:glycosyltransferase involved in cell wall biosynthesis